MSERRLAEPSLERVADDVHAWIQPTGDWGEANAGLVVGDGASLLVDTLWDETLAQRMLDAMAPLTAGAPIRTVVNTHSDGDHWWGNARTPADAEIVTSEASLAIMREADTSELVRFKRLGRALARLPGGVGAFGRYARRMLEPYALEEVTLRPATRAFAGEERLDVGGREVRLIQVGPAHTPGDLIVVVPDARVVFAADVLFVGCTPIVWAGPVARWQAALDTLLGLDADVYVPGHGPVSGRAEIEALREYWAWLEPAVAERHARGRSAWETAQELARSPEFAGAPWRSWVGPERIVLNVATIQRLLDGAPPSTSPLATMRLFSHVAALSRMLG
jgi:glyoxylase-like metal-dependent hydrolase (beta-lactamase superfamily II)